MNTQQEIRALRSHVVKKILEGYLTPLGKTPDNDLPIDTIEKVFLLAVEDYKKYRINLGELSNICNYLYGLSMLKSDTDQQLSNFSNLLESGADLGFYLAQADNERSAKIAISILKEVLEYKDQGLKSK